MNESLLFMALCILGWQGGTIHQVMEVLKVAKKISDFKVNSEKDLPGLLALSTELKMKIR
jgi:hypothetical protein